MITPKFKHDCDKCRFVGRLEGKDAYICTSSVILRYGDDGHEYDSVPKELAEGNMLSLLKYKIVLLMSKD